jgi:hypothetical protein
VLSHDQFCVVRRWLKARSVECNLTALETPVGLLHSFTIFRSDINSEAKPEEIVRGILEELGLSRCKFERSLLPPGIKPFPMLSSDGVWLLSGPTPELYGDAWKDRKRVEWPEMTPRSKSQRIGYLPYLRSRLLLFFNLTGIVTGLIGLTLCLLDPGVSQWCLAVNLAALVTNLLILVIWWVRWIML